MSSPRQRLRRFGAGIACAAMVAVGGASLAGTAGAGAPPSTPICPSSSANGRFVRYLYLNIMFRCPDASGGAYWTAKLDSGTPRSAVSNALDMSTENLVNNNVMPIYDQLLNRAPSSAELNAGVNSIRSTRSDASLTATIASSDEFFAQFSSESTPADAWIGAVYNGVLDRNPDEAGYYFFMDQLTPESSAGTRRWVVMTLEHSPENAADWTGAAMGGALLREPDQSGMAYWMGWLQGEGNWQTFRMWTLLLASPEAYSVAQSQPNPEEHSAAPRAMAPAFPRS